MSNFQDFFTNPDYISGYNAMLEHDISAHDIGMVYVEDSSDVMFWREFIEKYFSNRYRFRTASNGVTGKRALEKLYNTANIQALIAVDSDYDCIKAKSETDHPFNHNPYILHTFGFSRESALIEKDSLQNFLQRCQYTVPHRIDLANFINQFSQLAWVGLIRFITANYNDSYQLYGGVDLDHTESDFHQCFNITDKQFISENLALDHSPLATVKDNLDSLFQENNFFEDDLSLTRRILTELGINENNAYRFICGHTLDKLVKKIHKQLINALLKRERSAINENYDGKERKNRQKQLGNTFEPKFSLETFFTMYPINETDEIHQKILERVKAIKNEV